MTLAGLIVKLKKGTENGYYLILKSQVEEAEKIKASNEDFLIKVERLDLIYSRILGFLWGVSAFDFITEEECRELVQESIKITSYSHDLYSKEVISK